MKIKDYIPSIYSSLIDEEMILKINNSQYKDEVYKYICDEVDKYICDQKESHKDKDKSFERYRKGFINESDDYMQEDGICGKNGSREMFDWVMKFSEGFLYNKDRLIVRWLNKFDECERKYLESKESK